MYELLKQIVLTLLRCPKEPPEPPAGSHGTVHVFRASPSFLRYRLLKVLFHLVAIAIFIVIGAGGLTLGAQTAGRAGWFVILAGVAGELIVLVNILILYITVRLDYDMRYYIITDRSLRIREGAWQIRETTLTFANIQNMNIVQGPLERLFGIYDLVVDTAGGGGSSGHNSEGRLTGGILHQGVFRGIQNPAQLRDLILGYLRSIRTSGLGDHEDQEHAVGPALSPAAAPSASFLAHPEILAALRDIAAETAAWRRTLPPRSQEN